MSRLALQVTRTQVRRWFLVQTSILILAALGVLYVKGFFWAKSFGLGGLLCMLPQWVFAYMWLRYYKASAASKLVSVFYIGEVIKLFLTCALFIVVVKYIPINLISGITGFMIAQVAFWIAPLFSFKPKIN